jgi:hypothetical protein
MGVWGWHPAENDDAADFLFGVRAVIADAVGDAMHADNRARALDVLAIVTPLAAAGVDALDDEPDSRLHMMLPQPAFAEYERAISEPRRRPAFPDEGGIERWLRESGAPYDVWMRAAAFGDDAAAAFAACGDLHGQLAFARAAGLDDAALVRALATALLALPGAAALPADTATAVATAAETGALPADTATRLAHAGSAAYQTWVEERHTAIAGGRPPPQASATTALVQLAGALGAFAQAPAKSLGQLDRFADALPELPAQLSRALAPVIVAHANRSRPRPA